jgi:NAD-dependent dihydropyrimidine dehydrogenase PreA subunit
VLRPDPCLWDGSFANNAWLQECPKPLTKQVWGNALGLSPDEAKRLGLASGDLVRIEAGGRATQAPVLIEPGLPAGIGSLTLGYGRRKAGAIGTAIGADAYALRSSRAPWCLDDLTLTAMGRNEPILTPQNVVRHLDEVDALYPLRQLASLGHANVASAEPLPSLLPQRPPSEGYAWAMVIDASLCIGCNACVVACQAENNVPVVGPEEIARGRDMHWLRVDVYDHGSDALRTGLPGGRLRP